MSTFIDEQEILKYFETLSNAGRWGRDDERGTLNLITESKRREAAKLVRDGITISCSWPMDTLQAPDVAFGAMRRLMLFTGQGIDDPDSSESHPNMAGEYIGLVFHGQHVTHLDALCHMFWDKKIYNDFPASSVSPDGGGKHGAVTEATAGIVTRGILLDVARTRGVEWLEPGDGASAADLTRTEKEQGVSVCSGDAVLLRTGYSRRRRVRGRESLSSGHPGWRASCLPWLRERDVALIAADTSQDVYPNPYRRVRSPVHRVGLVAMGLWLLDNCDLEPLSEMCARLGRWEFQFIVAPLPIDGGTGSPVNPLAVF